ncbi:hypothetical protein GE061_011217 [Apolygus lucorum]|uniref:Uncharacterized protein n=1 Tax=Apolygus lucorum TaxID=248454 RepID=A0A8S9XX64_APOLU|nr:hypothetical protein GE061_011217 [Apolygus lucorum]
MKDEMRDEGGGASDQLVTGARERGNESRRATASQSSPALRLAFVSFQFSLSSVRTRTSLPARDPSVTVHDVSELKFEVTLIRQGGPLVTLRWLLTDEICLPVSPHRVINSQPVQRPVSTSMFQGCGGRYC